MKRPNCKNTNKSREKQDSQDRKSSRANVLTKRTTAMPITYLAQWLQRELPAGSSSAEIKELDLLERKNRHDKKENNDPGGNKENNNTQRKTERRYQILTVTFQRHESGNQPLLCDYESRTADVLACGARCEVHAVACFSAYGPP